MQSLAQLSPSLLVNSILQLRKSLQICVKKWQNCAACAAILRTKSSSNHQLGHQHSTPFFTVSWKISRVLCSEALEHLRRPTHAGMPHSIKDGLSMLPVVGIGCWRCEAIENSDNVIERICSQLIDCECNQKVDFEVTKRWFYLKAPVSCDWCYCIFT